MAGEGSLQGRIWSGWKQQGPRKAFLIGRRQTNSFRLLDGVLRGVLQGEHHKIAHGAPLKFGGTFEHGVQIGADVGFKTDAGAGCEHGEILSRLDVE